MIFVNIILLILITDLLTGTVHWWEDAYGNPNWKYLGKSVVIPNIEHHKTPRGFFKGNFVDRIKLSLIIAIILGIIFYFLDVINWQVIFCLAYGSLANEIHAITHRTDKENGKIICALQKIGLIQSRRMHGLHHTSPYDINYCVLTNYLNPILNKIGFWQKIETAISFFGISPTRGNLNRGGF